MSLWPCRTRPPAPLAQPSPPLDSTIQTVQASECPSFVCRGRRTVEQPAEKQQAELGAICGFQGLPPAPPAGGLALCSSSQLLLCAFKWWLPRNVGRDPRGLSCREPAQVLHPRRPAWLSSSPSLLSASHFLGGQHPLHQNGLLLSLTPWPTPCWVPPPLLLWLSCPS